MSTPASSIRIGIGETTITPIDNMQMCGFAKSQVSTGVHDDLYARALALESPDGVPAIMMTLVLSCVTLLVCAVSSAYHLHKKRILRCLHCVIRKR